MLLCILLAFIFTNFLCQLTCQSTDIMASLCSICVNNFSKSTRPRDMMCVLKDTLSPEDEKLLKAYKSLCFQELLKVRCPHPKCENFNTLSQFSHCIPDAKRGYYGFIIVVVRVRRDFLLATYSPHFFPDFFHIWQVA